MIKSIEKCIAIVNEYREAVNQYKAKCNEKKRKYEDGLIGKKQLRTDIEMLGQEMEKKAEKYKEQYQAAYQNAIEATRKAITTPKYISDTGFKDVIEAIEDSKGAYDGDPGVLRGMFEKYLDDYAARKKIADTLDKYTALKAAFFHINTENPLYYLQSLQPMSEFEFSSWGDQVGSLSSNAKLVERLENAIAIAEGEETLHLSRSITF